MDATGTRHVEIPTNDGQAVHGDLEVPAEPQGVVVFVHGSGSSRHSSRNRHVAGRLNDRGHATLLLDLLTEAEERVDVRTAQYRFDIALLARRAVAAVDWISERLGSDGLPAEGAVGLFGASTGAAAALIAAADRPGQVDAVVSRGGRPDLAVDALGQVTVPVLLIVGGEDHEVIDLNRQAADRMTAAPWEIEIVPGATHLFAEPGALDRVADLAGEWFDRHLSPARRSSNPDGTG